MRKAMFASLIAFFSNLFLLIIKGTAAYLSGSVALASDAVNSFTDVVSSAAIFFAVKISGKHADNDYQFGHKRAEPLAGIIVAVLGSVLGLEVLRSSVMGFISPGDITIGYFTILVMTVVIFVKLSLYIYFKILYVKHKKHPSLNALSVDSRNDMLISSLVLAGFFFYKVGYPFADSIAGLIIGVWIIRSSLKIGIDNSDYLMGKRPSEEMMNKIRKKAISVRGVKGLNDVFAQYVGPYIHTEVHIELEDDLKVPEAHDIAKRVGKKLEKTDVIDRAFIHIDPYTRTRRKTRIS
ncbi:MAG: cation diffusion facilitator family transporter [Candidatus Woesearchaeota archaeon]